MAFRNPNNLPTKVCVVCNRPFTWRKKWESSWDEITTCSKRCNSERKQSNRIARGAERAAAKADAVSVVADSTAVEGGAVTEPTPSSWSMADKVAFIADQAGVDGSQPLIKVIAAANDALGIEGEGTLAQQASVLVGQLQISPTTTDDAGDADLSELPEQDEAEYDDPKAARKAAKKAAKAEKRARREGTASHGQKSCDMCTRSVDLLIRCQVDSSKEWKMACGKCWKSPEVAGGVVDGDGTNPHYRYGGLWKNLHRQAP